jgi:transposase-like protein
MCPLCKNPNSRVRKRGFFFKKTTRSQRIQRYFCMDCWRSFSDQTGRLTYYEKKPHLDNVLFRLLCSGVSQRRCGVILNLHRKTVARKLVRKAKFARRDSEQLGATSKIEKVIFYEMETFEHTKCKPLSITVLVENKTRRILHLEVAQMPAKGLLAAISRKKYGHRSDHRPLSLERMLRKIKADCPDVTTIKTDKSPRYPGYIRKILPNAIHETTPGLRGCVVGQGELKATGRDPIFSLNHTCAMVRDNLKTMTRRTWCTSKRPDRLQCLLELYRCFHNFWVRKMFRKISISADRIFT